MTNFVKVCSCRFVFFRGVFWIIRNQYCVRAAYFMPAADFSRFCAPSSQRSPSIQLCCDLPVEVLLGTTGDGYIQSTCVSHHKQSTGPRKPQRDPEHTTISTKPAIVIDFCFFSGTCGAVFLLALRSRFIKIWVAVQMPANKHKLLLHFQLDFKFPPTPSFKGPRSHTPLPASISEVNREPESLTHKPQEHPNRLAACKPSAY